MGARYQSHGIRYNTVSLLQDVDSVATAQHIAEVAQRHSAELVGFQALAYDTPGYAHGTKDKNGVPVLLRKISELAKSYDLPFVVDAASCVPIIALSPEQLGADVMTWSMDKVARAPISGLIVGTEEALSPMRKGLGIAGQRYGEMRSHGKAAYSFADPGRDALAGLVEVLNTLRTNPERYTKPVDEMLTIVQEEFSQHLGRKDFLPDILITKSYLMGGIEVNYGRTWKPEAFGIPIFSAEDLFANTNPIMAAMTEMGVYPATIYSGNIFLSPGFGNLDQNGELLHNETRLAVRALVESIN
ncbi:MAG: hypothetical protein L0Z53_11580, partial [Acidobacteriales bacterium]|nr:hypothetical protein [Terriglobales bacterium]